jgi:hypothetical protein
MPILYMPMSGSTCLIFSPDLTKIPDQNPCQVEGEEEGPSYVISMRTCYKVHLNFPGGPQAHIM